MNHASEVGRKRGVRQGFTLAEVLVSAALLALAFTALLASFGHEAVVAQRGEDIMVATYLADEIRTMALQMSFADVLALNGTEYSPAVLSTGANHDVTYWSQHIAVAPVLAADLGVQDDSGAARAARIIVTVSAHGTPVVSATYYVFDISGVPFESGT